MVWRLVFVVYGLLFDETSSDENPQPFERIELIEPFEPYAFVWMALRKVTRYLTSQTSQTSQTSKTSFIVPKYQKKFLQ